MVYGVGINDMPRGWARRNKWNYNLYLKWHAMIQRCYSEAYHKKQPSYIGCTVCERWLIFSNFIEDFPKIDGYDEVKFLNNELELDKDIKTNGINKEYSLDNCTLVSKSENRRQANKTRDYSDMRNEKHFLYKKGHKKESIEKMSKAKKGKYIGKNNPRAKRVAQYSLDLNLIKIWDYTKQASIELKINYNHILNCCNGKRKSAGGFIWKFVEEENDNE